MVMNSIKDHNLAFDPLGPIIANLLNEAEKFNFFEVSTVRHTSNKVAHELAKHVSFITNCDV